MRALLLATLLTGTLFGQAAPAPQNQTPSQPDLNKKIAGMEAKLNDWPQLARYRAANAALPAPAAGEKRVVFYGDSITDVWKLGESFPGKPYVNRGISGQTTPQMLVRFQQDVVHLKPAAVVILAGTADISGVTGPSTPEMIADNIKSMIAIAKTNKIHVVLASILPTTHYSWAPSVQPAETIREVNARMKAIAARENVVYLDYYSAMTNAEGGLDPDLAKDGVHPTAKGYAIMAPLAEKAIARSMSVK